MYKPEFLEKWKALMNAFNRGMPRETLYTYVSYFGTLTPDNDEHVERMCKLSTPINSMEEWMDRYGLMAYPNVAAEAVAELAKSRQDEGESPVDYFMRIQALFKI